MSCGGGVGVCSPGGRSSTSWPGRWRHSREAPGRSRRITRSATPSATTVGSSTSASAHTKGTRDAEATASAHNKALAVKRQGAGCARRAGRHCRDSSRHSSVPRGHKRARGHRRERGREGPGGGMQGHCAAHDGHEWGGQKLSKLARDTHRAGAWAWMRYRACLCHEQVWRT